MSRSRTRKVLLCAVLTVVAIAGCSPPRPGEDVIVLAAASTIDALEAAADDFRERHGIGVVLSFGATSTSARQIVAGAPATLLLAASSEWANFVEQRTEVADRTTLVGNELVVVVTPGARPAATDAAGVLANPYAIERIALADPGSVPAGIYAREALLNLNIWDQLLPRLVPTVDVRAALVLVINGEADAAVVYASDAASTDHVRVAAALDAGLHDPIEYPLLLLAGANAASRQFFDFLVSEEGRAHFLSRGFSPTKPSPK